MLPPSTPRWFAFRFDSVEIMMLAAGVLLVVVIALVF